MKTPVIGYLFKIIIAINAFSLLSCVKENNVLFEMAYEANFEIAAGLNTLDEHNFVIPNIYIDTAQKWGAHNTNSSKFSAITPLSLRLSNVSTSRGYEFVDIASVVFVDATNPSISVEAFYRDPVPLNTGSDLELIPTLANFKTMFMKNRININVRLRLRNPSPEFINTRMLIRMGVR